MNAVSAYKKKTLLQRHGLVTRPHPEKQEGSPSLDWRYFQGANIAIIEELALQAFPAALTRSQTLPEFRAACEKTLQHVPKEVIDHPEAIHTLSGADTLPLMDEGDSYNLPFSPQRAVIEQITSVLHREQPTAFPTIASVHEAFFRVFFAGSWLSLGKAIELNYGSGALRVLANMTDKRDSAILTLELLRRLEKRTKRTSIERPVLVRSDAGALPPTERRIHKEGAEPTLDPKAGIEDALSDLGTLLFQGVKQRNTTELKTYADLANRLTADCMRRLGLEPTFIDSQDIHFIRDPKHIFLEPNIRGLHKGKTILINANLIEAPMQLLSTLIHEELHGKGYESLEEKGVGAGSIETSGLSVVSHKSPPNAEKRIRGEGLNEAIVQLLTQRCFQQAAHEHPEIAQEKAWQNSKEGRQKIRELSTSGLPYAYIFTLDRSGRRAYGPSYFYQTRTLRFVVESIYHDYKDTLSTPDAVLDLFGRAHFDGNRDPIQRVTSHAFGEAGYLALESMGTESPDGKRTLELMQKLRIDQLKRRKPPSSG